MNNPWPLLETIRCQNGQFPLLRWHQDRINDAFRTLWPGKPAHDLWLHLQNSAVPPEGLFKCRVLYGEIIKEPEYVPYVIDPPRRLRLVEADDIDYGLKWSDRQKLNDLHNLRGDCDDVLIVRRGMITDTTYCNIAFLRDTTWFTPANPLLKGVRRAYLLEMGIIEPLSITRPDLGSFTHFKLFNAMIGWDDSPAIPITEIRA